MSDIQQKTLKSLEEALELAQTATTLDTMKNYLGAIDYYDKCLLSINEVLNTIPPSTELWNNLSQKRSEYDDRMEYLRESESAKYNLVAPRITKFKRQSQVPFKYNSALCNIDKMKEYQYPPHSISRIPFWQMRLIRTSIEEGGFITPRLCVPKDVWTQVHVKFSGLSAKSTAYKSIIELASSVMSGLTLALDAQSLRLAQAGFRSLMEEFVSLQNQLAKPFPFIREVAYQTPGETPTLSPLNPTTPTPGTESANLTEDSQVARLSSFVSTWSKRAVKMAEVGLHRFSTLPAHVSEEDFAAFKTLTAHLCGHMQVFDEWIEALERERVRLLSLPLPPISSYPPSYSSLPSSSSPSSPPLPPPLPPKPKNLFHSGETKKPREKEREGGEEVQIGVGEFVEEEVRVGREGEKDGRDGERGFVVLGVEEREEGEGGREKEGQRRVVYPLLTEVEVCLSLLGSLSSFMREVVCEIMVRDTEALVERYITKMKKSFSRMYWDEEEGGMGSDIL